MAPASCSLERSELIAQRERYRLLGIRATVIERDAMQLVIRVDDAVGGNLVDELIAIERQCCPFFELDWDPASRSFAASVPESRYEPALDAIAYALGIDS